MATDTNTASIIPLHQPKTPLTPAQRARAYRLRQKAAGKPMTVVTPAVMPPMTTVTPSRITKTVTPSRRQLVPVRLTVTAFGVALVGITMNGSFAIPTVSKRVGVGSSSMQSESDHGR